MLPQATFLCNKYLSVLDLVDSEGGKPYSSSLQELDLTKVHVPKAAPFFTEYVLVIHEDLSITYRKNQKGVEKNKEKKRTCGEEKRTIVSEDTDLC